MGYNCLYLLLSALVCLMVPSVDISLFLRFVVGTLYVLVS